MTMITVSRRNMLATGACALVGAVSLPELARASESGAKNLMSEELIRKWYTVWKDKDFATFNNMLADNFTFSSAAGDDHISKSTFKTQCWDTQINFIKDFDLERVTTGPNDAFVKYLCYTKNGKSLEADPGCAGDLATEGRTGTIIRVHGSASKKIPGIGASARSSTSSKPMST